VTRGIALAEFAAMEIGLAVRASKHSVQQMMSMTRRLQAETPDAWDAWQAGDINHAKAIRINRAVRRLVRDESKRMLKHDGRRRGGVQTAELLGRWLNQFIARVEPEQTDERLRRRYRIGTCRCAPTSTASAS